MSRKNLGCMMFLVVTLLLGGCSSSSALETTAAPAVMDTAEATETTILEASTVENNLDDGNNIENVKSKKVIDEDFASKDNDLNWPLYSLQEINEGKLGNKIVFNSINYQPTDYQWHKDHYGTEVPAGTILNESDFVGARENTGINAGANNVWNGDRIKVEEGKEYIVRLYVHNNNPGGENAIAENTRVSFNIPNTSASLVEVGGFIYSDNATVSGLPYYDNVLFENDGTPFHLEYIDGSAKLENNGFANAANGGAQLSDAIVDAKDGGVLIGYDGLDGKIPGCYQYAQYVTIKVKAEFNYDYTIEKQVRLEGDKEWQKTVEAKVGDTVEFLIEYTNTSNLTQSGVVIKDILPNNLEYIASSTTLKNAATNGQTVDINGDFLVQDGLAIGSYTSGSNAIIKFKAKVVDNSLGYGSNTLVNWAQAGVGDKVIQDYANVVVNYEN